MENRLKERLTGAAILVALIVLVVPEMFHGSRSAAPAAQDGSSSSPAGPAGPAGAAAQGPPLRSYTIDLSGAGAPSSGAGAPSAPLQSSSPVAPHAADTAPAAAGAEGPAAAVAPAAAPSPAVSSRGAVAVPRKALVSRNNSPAPPQTPASKASAGPAAPSGWSVQLGLFAKGDNAQRLARTARAKGFATHISRTEPRGLYRVWVAGLSDRSAAEQLSRKLHAAGLPAAVMRPR